MIATISARGPNVKRPGGGRGTGAVNSPFCGHVLRHAVSPNPCVPSVRALRVGVRHPRGILGHVATEPPERVHHSLQIPSRSLESLA
jgi:hypothetical protein